MIRIACIVLLSMLSLPGVAATRVVASTHPLAMIASAAVLPDTDLQVLMTPALSSPEFRLSGRELKLLEEAELVVWTGPEAEPWLAGALAEPREGRQLVTLSKLPGVVRRDYRLDANDAGAHGANPHLWLSTQNAALLARAVGARLGNTLAAEHFANEMQRFRNRQLARFQPVATLGLLAADDVFGYLFAEIGVVNVAALSAAASVAPEPRRVAELAERARREDIACVVGPPGFEQGPAAQLLPAGHGHLVTLDPMLVGIPPARDSYTLALIQLADTLFGCIVTR